MPTSAHTVTAGPKVDADVRRGSRKRLAAILALSLLNLPLMLARDGSASPIAHNPVHAPNTILITILLAWATTHRYAKPTANGRPPPPAGCGRGAYAHRGLNQPDAEPTA